ncbi:MAG: acyl-CoA dehydrogenase family protein, partial [Negativicutes bacterium]|nr:acyl-CoA dehydrogenase family protein [Negativicutes bacterium]MDR3590302.1 acyl-CoA dehydrogenase family protein [Negativicutes bacterium]
MTEEQKMMQKMAKDFAEKKLAPGAAERDEKEEFSREMYDAMVEMG